MSNRLGLRKRTQQTEITIQKPPKKEGEFYFCSFVVDDLHHFNGVTDLTDKDIINVAKRKVKNPNKIHLKINKSWQTI